MKLGFRGRVVAPERVHVLGDVRQLLGVVDSSIDRNGWEHLGEPADFLFQNVFSLRYQRKRQTVCTWQAFPNYSTLLGRDLDPELSFFLLAQLFEDKAGSLLV